jgi:protein-disulfide isomerase
MKRLQLLGALAAVTLALPAQALDLSAMTEAEREAFRAEVRAYLLENPEVLMEAIAILEQRQTEDQIAADRNKVAANADELFADADSWVGGNPDGDVTVVEFMDYRCSFCRRAHPEVNALIEGDGNIRYIVKEFPILGDESVAAARFALAVRAVAGDSAYEDVHDRLMTARGNMNEETFARVAEEFGLDTEAIMVEMGSPEIDRILQENYALAQALEISGTPSFVFQTDLVRGYVPLDSMQGIVRAIRDGS